VQTTSSFSLDQPVEGTSADLVSFFFTVPDAERLLIQSGFVRNQIEAELLCELESRISQATLLDPADVPPDLVTMNSRLLLRDVETGHRISVTLVFPTCVNPRKGRISVLTPLGSMLLGARLGQTLTSAISGTLATVIIESILYQPEAADDYYG
jgi:regulator of nucleoside diphosphate kinase